MSPTIEVKQIYKSFGAINALIDVSFHLNEGEIVALLGPNGAGKSTLLKIIAAQMLPTSGSVNVLNQDSVKEREEVKKNVGVVGHRSYMYAELSVEENLRFYGQFFDAKSEEYNNAIEATGLQKWRNVKTSFLSFGLKKRCDIARALLGDPKILILDEFFSGLDQDTSNSLIDHFKALENKTIFISSHSYERIRLLCNRGIHLRRGFLEKDEVF
ncbi:MAG: ABC transporter ATP-binding protein [Candidatus Thorarchaeota archaeon]|jgi:ABC-type multidrug transport system ATPase subunit